MLKFAIICLAALGAGLGMRELGLAASNNWVNIGVGAAVGLLVAYVISKNWK